jgi:hypothetical protein
MPRLVFGRWLVRISAVTYNFNGFPEFLDANSGTVLLLHYSHLFPDNFLFFINLSSYNPTPCKIDTEKHTYIKYQKSVMAVSEHGRSDFT